ncbi:MAG: hypothetical protein ABH865_07910 [Candidatus Omnitrophota bacterium]
MGHYYIPLTKSKKRLIWSGWRWPHENLGKIVDRHLSSGKEIIIDFDGFRYDPNKKKDIMNVMVMYKTKKLGSNLVQLYK